MTLDVQLSFYFKLCVAAYTNVMWPEITRAERCKTRCKVTSHASWSIPRRFQLALGSLRSSFFSFFFFFLHHSFFWMTQIRVKSRQNICSEGQISQGYIYRRKSSDSLLGWGQMQSLEIWLTQIFIFTAFVTQLKDYPPFSFEQ